MPVNNNSEKQENIEKKDYQTPVLIEYGHLAALTQMFPNKGADGGAFPDCRKS